MSALEDHIDDQWWIVSYHEAGHAVALVVFDLLLHEIEIGVDGRGSSHGLTYGDVPPADQIDDVMVTCLAGGSAELRLLHQWGWPQRVAESHARAGAQTDMANAAALERRTGLSLDEAEREAVDLVDEYWDAIEEVAEAIRENNGYLSGADCEAIVREF
jgi:hypothetical protein